LGITGFASHKEKQEQIYIVLNKVTKRHAFDHQVVWNSLWDQEFAKCSGLRRIKFETLNVSFSYYVMSLTSTSHD